MNKTFLIFKHEFLQAIKKTGFIVLTFIVPVLALLAIGSYELVTTLIEPSAKEVTTVGYVDEVGIFSDQTDQGLIKLVPYISREDATWALVRKDVSEYIVIPSDYIFSGTVQRYTLVKESKIQELAKAGVAVNLWAVNEEGDMRRFIVAGAAGIITDFPQRLSRILNES